MMPAISKSAEVSQTDEWRANRRVLLYHSCIDILSSSTKINDLVGRDVYIRFADNMTRRSRVFLDFLCMDGDEVSTATMWPLHSALHAGAPEIYWIRRKTLSLFVIQLRCAVSCRRNVNGCLIPTGRLVIDARKRYISSIYRLYSCHMLTSFHLYTDSIFLGR